MGKATVVEVFEECQKGLHSHGKLVKKMAKLYKSMTLESFWEVFVTNLRYAMTVFKREVAVDRTIEFVSKFATAVPDKDIAVEQEQAKDGSDDEPDDEDMTRFLSKLFDFLLKNHDACNKAVRYRCCQLINKLLHNMGDEAQIDDGLYDKIYECMLMRLRDKFPIVRLHAVFALNRLQDPTDVDCPIINAYVFLLGCDANSDVRRAVLTNIAPSTKTLPSILERTRDTHDAVRKLAYQILAEKVHIKALSIAQRVKLLQDGLNDRTEAVKDSCSSKLLQAWLRTFEGSIVEMLQCLDVESCLDLAEKTIFCLFKKVPAKELVQSISADMLNDTLVLPIDDLACESVLYWRCLAEHLKGMGAEGDELLDKIVPNATALAKYITDVFERMRVEDDVEKELGNEFVMQQLLALVGVLDLSDEVGRRHVDKLVRDLLISDKVSHRLVKPLLKRYVEIHTDSKSRLDQLVETISEIRQPSTIVQTPRSKDRQRQNELKIAGVRVELNQLRDQLDEAIQAQDFTGAAEVKSKITELEQRKQTLIQEGETLSLQEGRQEEKNDPATLLKCLSIAAEMMETANLPTMTPSVLTLIQFLILPGITHQDPAVRNQAVRSLGLCSLVSQDMAKSHLVLFIQVSQMDQATVKMTALQVIFDLLHSYGLETFNVDAAEEENDDEEDQSKDSDEELQPFSGDSDSDFEDSIVKRKQKPQKPPKDDMPKEPVHTANSLLQILAGLLDSETSEVRTVAAEGLAKLMLSGRVVSHKLLSRLLLLWYNPITEDDQHLRHCLGAFFTVFAFSNRANQDIMEEAFLPTLRTIFRAPPDSPLREVNVNNVVELMVQLTNARHLVNQVASQLDDSTCHDNLAIKVCNEILSAPNDFNVRTLCRLLADLELTPTNVICLKDLRILASQMRKKVKDKQCLKTVEKFRTVVKDLLKNSGLDSTANQTRAVDDTVMDVSQESQSTAATGGDKGGTDSAMDTGADTADERQEEAIQKQQETETPANQLETQEPAEVEKAVSELTDRTNQMDLEETSSQASSEQLDDKPRRRGKRTKKESNLTDSDAEVVSKRPSRAATKSSQEPPAASKRVAQLQGDKATATESSGSELENDEVFSSATTLRKITRGRKAKQTVDVVKKKLTNELEDSQDDSEPPTRKSSRPTRTRAARKK